MRGTLAWRGFYFLLLASSLAGCGRNDIQVYRVAKETSPEPPMSSTMPASGSSSEAGGVSPALKWTLPTGWREVAPGQMRVASFQVQGKGGEQADVSIVPLQGPAGGDLGNLNRWRDQVSLPAVSEEEMTKLAESVEIAGQPGKLFDQVGTVRDSGAKARVIAAYIRRDDTTWFFKMTGADSLVAAQKPVFIGFVNSIQFVAPEASTASSLTKSGDPVWEVPAGWRQVPAMNPLFAKYQISGDGDAQAAVNISVADKDGGGPLANVNRWRGQIGLEPIGEVDLTKELHSLDVQGGKAMVIDMSGTDPRTQQKARVIAAIVSVAGRTWFYKLMGSAPLVDRESVAFTKFVQTVKYSDGR